MTVSSSFGLDSFCPRLQYPDLFHFPIPSVHPFSLTAMCLSSFLSLSNSPPLRFSERLGSYCACPYSGCFLLWFSLNLLFSPPSSALRSSSFHGFPFDTPSPRTTVPQSFIPTPVQYQLGRGSSSCPTPSRQIFLPVAWYLFP